MTQYLTFLVEDECYAANLANITEIADITGVIKVPKQPEYVMGMLQHMGRDLAVVDIRKLLTRKKNTSAAKCVLVFDIEGIKVGFAVDKVDEVIILSDARSMPEYMTIMNHTQLLSPKQLEEVQNPGRWGDHRKRIEIRTLRQRAERSHI